MNSWLMTGSRSTGKSQTPSTVTGGAGANSLSGLSAEAAVGDQHHRYHCSEHDEPFHASPLGCCRPEPLSRSSPRRCGNDHRSFGLHRSRCCLLPTNGRGRGSGPPEPSHGRLQRIEIWTRDSKRPGVPSIGRPSFRVRRVCFVHVGDGQRRRDDRTRPTNGEYGRVLPCRSVANSVTCDSPLHLA
jgi:hypothetical protein